MIFVSSKISDGNMLSLGNRKRFFKKIGINPKKIAEVKQVHGNKVLLIDNILNPNIEADGLITNKEGLYLTLKVADCMAISFYDHKHNAIGLIHIGWKGLENKIIKRAVEIMKQNFDTNPKEVIINISPSIGPCHYRMDLWTEAEKQLKETGVLIKNIHNPKICTYENKDYFSHRRSEDTNQPEGRFVTIIGLNHVN